MSLVFDQVGCCFSSFVIYSGCAWPVPPLLLVEGVLTDFLGGSLVEAGHARPEEPRKTLTKEASTGPRQAHAWIEVQNRDLDAEGGQDLAKALPLSSSGVLRTALCLPIPTARLQWW